MHETQYIHDTRITSINVCQQFNYILIKNCKSFDDAYKMSCVNIAVYQNCIISIYIHRSY